MTPRAKSAGRTEVLVVGAGPVGLCTALWLSQRGVRVRIVDKYQRAALYSYALALHPRSLALLDELGVAAPLIARGQRVDRIAVYHAGEPVAELDVGAVGGEFPFVLVLPQPLLEAALEQRLRDNGVEVDWGRLLLSFESAADSVTALLAETREDSPADGEVEVSTTRIRAAYLVGADGLESLVRLRLGLRFTAVGGPLSYALMEFEGRLANPGTMHLLLGERTTDVLWPLAGDRGRFSLQLPEGAEVPDPESFRRTVRRRAPWFRGRIGAVEWLTSIRFVPRLIERFGEGRTWLVGDAARSTSPLGVQGLNVGLREAHELARRLASALRERGKPDLLRYYNEERRREWRRMLGIDDRLRIDGRAPRWAREAGGRLVPTLPASGADLNALLGQVGLRLRRRRDRGA